MSSAFQVNDEIKGDDTELDDVTEKVVKVFRRRRAREEDPSALGVAVDKKPKEDGPCMNI